MLLPRAVGQTVTRVDFVELKSGLGMGIPRLTSMLSCVSVCQPRSCTCAKIQKVSIIMRYEGHEFSIF